MAKNTVMNFKSMSLEQVANLVRDEFMKEMPRINQILDTTLRELAQSQKKRYALIIPSQSKLEEIFLYIHDTCKRRFALGIWLTDAHGYKFVQLEQRWVTFYNAHFFERYAERYLRSARQPKKAAREFFFAKAGQELDRLRADTPLTHIDVIKFVSGGVAIGLRNIRHEFTVMRTFIDKESLNAYKAASYKEYGTQECLLHRIQFTSPDVLAELYRLWRV